MRFFNLTENDNDKKGGDSNSSDSIYYGTTSDAYDLRFQDDSHMTYGRSYDYNKEDNND